MKHHLVTAAFLVGAVLCYIAGSSAGMIVFAAVGLVLECVFWFRVFRARRPAG